MLARLPVPLRIIVQSLSDWWRELLVLSIVNFLWIALLLPVVTAPAATAALFSVGWQSARRDDLRVGDFIVAFRRYLLSSIPLFLFTVLGSAFVGFDVFYYITLLNGGSLQLNSLVTWTGIYLLTLWAQYLGYCWGGFVARNDVGFGGTLKNASILTFRFTGTNLVVSIFLILLLAASVFPILLAFATFAIIAQTVGESMLALAPELVGHAVDWVPEEERIDTWK